jgi:hypothetical protein
MTRRTASLGSPSPARASALALFAGRMRERIIAAIEPAQRCVVALAPSTGYRRSAFSGFPQRGSSSAAILRGLLSPVVAGALLGLTALPASAEPTVKEYAAAINDSCAAGRPPYTLMLSRMDEEAGRERLAAGIQLEVLANAGVNGIYKVTCPASAKAAPPIAETEAGRLVARIQDAASAGQRHLSLTFSREHEAAVREALGPKYQIDLVAIGGVIGVYEITLPIIER